MQRPCLRLGRRRDSPWLLLAARWLGGWILYSLSLSLSFARAMAKGKPRPLSLSLSLFFSRAWRRVSSPGLQSPPIRVWNGSGGEKRA